MKMRIYDTVCLWEYYFSSIYGSIILVKYIIHVYTLCMCHVCNQHYFKKLFNIKITSNGYITNPIQPQIKFSQISKIFLVD